MHRAEELHDDIMHSYSIHQDVDLLLVDLLKNEAKKTKEDEVDAMYYMTHGGEG